MIASKSTRGLSGIADSELPETTPGRNGMAYDALLPTFSRISPDSRGLLCGAYRGHLSSI
jgi:hypothetical protein